MRSRFGDSRSTRTEATDAEHDPGYASSHLSTKGRDKVGDKDCKPIKAILAGAMRTMLIVPASALARNQLLIQGAIL